MALDHLRLVRLGPPDAGELLTVQRAAYATQAQLHDDPHLPPLRQTLAEVRTELEGPGVDAVGLRLGPEPPGRLVGGVRLQSIGAGVVELARLVVVPDLQGQGLGTRLLRAAMDGVPPGTREVRLFTGEHSAANLRLYRRHGFRETHRSPAGGYDLVHLVREVGLW